MKCMEIIHAKFRSARKLRVSRCGWFYTKSTDGIQRGNGKKEEEEYLVFTGYSIIKILIDHYFKTFLGSNSQKIFSK